MKKVFISSLVLFLLVGCSSSTPNLSTNNNLNSQFDTKALTESYLKKKMDKWLSDPTKYAKNIVREVEYAKFKHPGILKSLVNQENSIYDSIIVENNVIQKRSIDAPFDDYVKFLNPYDTSENTTVNYALNANISSYSAYYTPHGSAEIPQRVNDGNTNTQWASGSAGLPQWITINLGSQKSISKVRVMPTDNTAYYIQGSNDGTNFTTLANVSSAGSIWRDIPITLAYYQYIRLYAYNCGGWVSIREIEVY